MSRAAGRSPKLLRLSGILLLTGLGIEAISLRWIHPIAFLLFFIAGGACLAAGVLLFLYLLLFRSDPLNSNDSPVN